MQSVKFGVLAIVWFVLCIMLLVLGAIIFLSDKPVPLEEGAWTEMVPCVMITPREYPPACHATPVQWWNETTLCDVAVTLPFRDNLKKLHAFLGTQIKAVDLACSRTSYNKDGINEPCLNAYMLMQTAVDTFLKTMVVDHGGPLIGGQ